MLSVRPRELRLVIQHHQAAMMTISCTRLSFYNLLSSRKYVHSSKLYSLTNVAFLDIAEVFIQQVSLDTL